MSLSNPGHADLFGALLDLCQATARDLPWTELEDGNAADWEHLTELADQHGLVSLLHNQAARSEQIGAPAGLRSCWRDQYRRQLIRNACGMRQIRQLARACAAEGIDLVLLKGAAALLWLYEDRGMRLLGDLDVLVPRAKADRAVNVLAELGYQPISKAVTRRSVEEAYLAEQRRLHFPQLIRGHELPIELHVRLFRQADGRPVLPDVWSDAFSPDANFPHLRVLSPTHSLLHGSIHYWKHLREGFCPLKSLVDLLLIVQQHGEELDWRKLWATARYWGILNEAATVLATVARIGDLSVPGIPIGTFPLSDDELIFGRAPSPEPEAWQTNWGYIARARQLNGLSSRTRYLLRTLFPEPEYLRARLNLSPNSPLAGAYLRYSCTGILRAAQLSLAPFLRRPVRSHALKRSSRHRGAP